MKVYQTEGEATIDCFKRLLKRFYYFSFVLNGLMAGVATPASLGFPLSYHRHIVATKFTTSLVPSAQYYYIALHLEHQ